ncbi:hypothetical protein HAX54_034241, partial [Datura stramonium]|nr:hypothetical protein [Datura stramonium]
MIQYSRLFHEISLAALTTRKAVVLVPEKGRYRGTISQIWPSDCCSLLYRHQQMALS